MDNFSALLDANIFYPAPLRDVMLSLADHGLYRVRWSNMIMEEWERNLLINRQDLNKEALQRTTKKMDSAFPDASIADFEPLIDSLELPDVDDRHVLAAAIVGRSDVIVTKNLKDFPEKYLDIFNIEAQHPDEFIRNLINIRQGKVCEALATHRARLKNPPKTVEEYLATLTKQELPMTVAELSSCKMYL